MRLSLPLSRALNCSLNPHYSFATLSINNSAQHFQIFDRNAKKRQKDRAITRTEGNSSRETEYLRNEVAERLIERFSDIRRQFDTVLDLGAGSGHFTKLLELSHARKALMLDSSKKSLFRDDDSQFEVEIERIQCDEELLLETVEANSQEAIVSCLNLHWVNDLPGILIQIKEALKPDGVFLCALPGGDTLFELRTALQLAGVDLRGGISPYISPMTDTRDMSNLMSRAGFTLLTVDIEEVRVLYPSMWELIHDLRDMGESNAVLERRHIIDRDILLAASSIYKELHGLEGNSIPATFQIIFVIGWKPSPSQTQPSERGSGQTNLKHVL